MNENNIKRILGLLLKGRKVIEESFCNGDKFYISCYRFSILGLSEDELKLLKTTLTGSDKDGQFSCWVSDVNQVPVLFDKRDDADQTIEREMRHLEKRFLFATYNETGILYQPPKKANVTFFKKEKITEVKNEK